MSSNRYWLWFLPPVEPLKGKLLMAYSVVLFVLHHVNTVEDRRKYCGVAKPDGAGSGL